MELKERMRVRMKRLTFGAGLSAEKGFKLVLLQAANVSPSRDLTMVLRSWSFRGVRVKH